MSCPSPRIVFAIAVAAAAGFLVVPANRAQESWGGGTSASSSWHAGTNSTSSSSTSAHAVIPGSSSSWTAGKGTFGTGSQPGGVWREASTSSAIGAATGRKMTSTEANPFGRASTLPGARPALHSTAGAHPSSGSSGMKNSGRGAPSKSPFAHASTGNHSSRLGSNGTAMHKISTGSSFGSSSSDRLKTNSLESHSSSPFGKSVSDSLPGLPRQ